MDLDILKNRIGQAKAEMCKELERRYKDRVFVVLNSRQKTPTRGKAVGYDGDGYVLVRIDSAGERSRRSVRSIHYSRIISTYSGTKKERREAAAPRPLSLS